MSREDLFEQVVDACILVGIVMLTLFLTTLGLWGTIVVARHIANELRTLL